MPDPGWYEPPDEPGTERWWDGEQWTGRYRGRWEYLIEEHNISERWSSKRQAKELQNFNAYLNRLGQQGWEMINYSAVPMTGNFTGNIKGYAYLAYFKRPA